MGGYVRMDKDLAEDPRVLAIAKRWAAELKIQGVENVTLECNACNTLLGGLYRLWRYADTYVAGHNKINVTLDVISDVTLLPLHIVQSLPHEWLRLEQNGTVELPNYSEKNAISDKDIRREQTRVRVRRFREKQKLEVSNAGVTRRKRKSNGDDRYSNADVTLLPYPDPDPPRPGPGDARSAAGAEPPAASRQENFREEFRARFGSYPEEKSSTPEKPK